MVEVPPNVLEFQIGQIDTTVDSVEALSPFMIDMEEGIKAMKPNTHGHSNVCI